MLNSIRQIFRKAKAPVRLPAAPEGERYYVVGDVHGRLDLFDALRRGIEDDDGASPQANSTVVLLGDLVDRGPHSAGVIASAREWQSLRPLRCLAGNHEEMFLDSFEDKDVLRHFLKHGGRETIMSYGISREELDALGLGELQAELPRLVPEGDRAFLQTLEEMITAGNYVFVHAGVDPLRAMDNQSRNDLLWIRERFLRHADPLSHVVVHGHTIFEEIEDRGHRIGIDTGAYRTGVLTALVLDGTQQRYIQAVDNDGTITIRHTGGIK